jgi:hypothetical protein
MMGSEPGPASASAIAVFHRLPAFSLVDRSGKRELDSTHRLWKARVARSG